MLFEFSAAQDDEDPLFLSCSREIALISTISQKVPLTGGRSGRKVVQSVLSRWRGRPPACPLAGRPVGELASVNVCRGTLRSPTVCLRRLVDVRLIVGFFELVE
jgi:hypothetical protein